MTRWPLLIAALALLAGCERELTPAEQAAADARAIAQVEAAQEVHPPLEPISPEQITPVEIEQNQLFGAGCSFAPQGAADPVLLMRSSRAVMKLDGRLTTFASDPGSGRMPVETWGHYVGKERSLRIEKGGGEGVRTGEEALDWPATLSVRDEFDRIVYRGTGRLSCGT